MKKYFGLIVLVLFAVIQMSTSFVGTNWYPFSAYRMFSRHLPSGVKMDKVRFYDTQQSRSFSPQEVFRVPFFQANHISFVTFLDVSPEPQRKAACHLALEATGAKSLDVFGEVEEYKRISNVELRVETIESKKLYVCQ